MLYLFLKRGLRLTLFIIFLINISSVSVFAARWYTLASGDWDDPTIWTLDPSGSLPNNPGNLTPTTSATAATDEVYILSGRTITVSSNSKTNASLNVAGRIDFKATTGHTFTEIRGSGKIILKADNFPSGDATHFITKDQGEGTVVFDSTGYDLTTAQTFYHVDVDLDNATDVLVLLDDYQIDGDLTISSGVFRINNNSSTTALNLSVKGTTTINSGTSFTVGTGNAVHDVEFQGDVTNNGTLDFANNTQYNCATTGAAKVTFIGTSDNTLTCNGTTDFYRLFLDKGTDETYILDVVSTNVTNFRLFGPVAGGGCQDAGAEGWENLALVLHNGTLKLGANIDIPILGANRTGTGTPNEFHIPAGTRLWIDGADVSTHTTGGGWRGITIFGTLQVTSGTFTNPDNTGGITYFSNVAEPGKLVLEGGTVTTTQVKQANTNGRFSYIQSGGTLNINNLSDSRGSSAVFALPQPDYVFNMSGGLIQIDAINTTATNGIDIGCDDGNINVTGGTIELLIPTENASAHPEFEINSTAPFWNLTLTESANPNSQTVVLQSDLTILNDFTIGANTEFDADGYDLAIGGDFVLEDGGTYTHGDNTTYFIGNQNSDIDINNSTDVPALQFYNLVIEKDQRGNPLLFRDLGIDNCPGRSQDPADADNSIIEIENDLTITRGQFTIERYTVSLLGDVAITDGKLIYNSARPGRLRLEGSAAQSITGSALYNPEFGNIELDNSNGATITTDASLDNFILTTGILDIGTNRLSIDTNFVENGNAVAFSASKMIETSADHGAKGLKLRMDADYTGGATVTFPVGSNGNWAKCDVNISSSVGSVNGYLTVAPVNQYHPTRPVGGCDAIDGYWKTKSSGLSGTTSGIEYQFYSPYADPPGGGDREYYLIAGVWTSSGSASTPGTITYEDANLNGFPQEADFTIGKNACFNNVSTIVSATTGNWNVGSTWVGGTAPATYDYAVIRDGHTVSVTRNNQDDAGKVTVDAGGTLDIGIYTGLTYNIVQGGGTIRIASNTIPTADFEDFMYNDTSVFEYYGGAYTIPNDFNVYPNLKITGTGNKTMANQDVLVRKNLFIDGQTLLLNDGDDVVVNDSVIFDNAGILQFPNGANSCIVTVNKSIDLSGSSAANTIEVATGGAYTNNHSLTVSEDIVLTASSTITLFRNNGDKAVDLYFDGDVNSNVNNAGATINLNRLIIDKSDYTANIQFRNEFSLGGPTNGNSDEKALYLINGDLSIRNGNTDFYLTSGGEDFVIPTTASLNLFNATVRASGSNTGIYLDGYLRIGNGSSCLLNEGTNNYIEYSASGNAEIRIDNGTLRVGSQIRRSSLTTEGILIFNQTNSGSTVVLGETDAPENRRGIFEILNAGSDFTQVADASITIIQSQTTPAFPALYLDPETSSIGTGAGFVFGNGSTPASDNMGIYSSVDLQNITIDGTQTPTITLWTVPLTLNEDLIIESGASFDANGLDLIIKGDFLNSGTFNANSNTTYFSGSGNQRLLGNTTFHNLTKTTSNELWLAYNAADITVSNNLDFQSGTLRDSSNTVTLLGNCNFGGTHIHGSQAGDGFYFNGSAEQELTGSGTFGKLSINNSSGILVPLGNNLTISDTLKLMDGVIAIGKNLLTLSVNAEIEEANPFSATNMIQTNVSFTDLGVRKYLPSGARTFIYPIGSGGKYTPVTFTITANSSSTGYITIKAANELHPSIQEDSEAPDPEITDAENVLQYHWVIRSSGISGFSATANMKYIPADALANAPEYDIYDYITARLLNDGSGLWNKYDDVDKVDETNEILIFDFAGVNDAGISGDYTAGVDGSSFNGAIPDQVPSYETNSSGSWSTATIWTPNVTGGPRGAITLINTGHTVTAPANFLSNYTTEVQGAVSLGTTFGHRFGEVTGSGRITTNIGRIPAGIYDNFFSAGGGTIEFAGSTDHDVMGEHTTLNSALFSGIGERRLPNNNLIFNGDFEINGGASLDVINEYDKEIEIKGDLIRTAGTFESGTGSSASILLSSGFTQTISGDFTSTNSLNILEMDNANGVTLNGDVTVDRQLVLTNGAITPGSNSLTISLAATISPASGTSTQNINGELSKVMTSSQDFVYPVGDNGNLGTIELVDVTGFSGAGTWSAEYNFTNPTTDGYDATSYGSPIDYVSQTEYWSIQGPSGGQSDLTITLDGSSDVANAISNLSNLRFVGWDGSQWVQVGGTPSVSGTATSGSISTGAAIDFDTYQYITLGSNQPITLGTASIVSTDVSICNGTSTDIIISLTGATPWSITYTDGTTPVTIPGIVSSPYTLNVSPTSTTTYTLTAVSDNNGPGTLVGNIDVIVTVNALPVPSITGDASACEGSVGNVYSTESGMGNYTWGVSAGAIVTAGGTIFDNSITVTWSGTGTQTISINYTNAAGCTASICN